MHCDPGLEVSCSRRSLSTSPLMPLRPWPAVAGGCNRLSPPHCSSDWRTARLSVMNIRLRGH